MNEDTKYLIALSRIPGIGSVNLNRLVQVFGSGEQAWQASRQALEQAAFSVQILEAWDQRKEIDPDQEIQKVRDTGVRLCRPDQKEYPSLLKHIYSPPELLYVRGHCEQDYPLSLAIVGSRKCTSYGRQAAVRLATDLSQAGLAIVSGLALGLDAVVHEAVVKAGGVALAVLGSGVDQVYPQTNAKLAQKVMQKGALISELPLGTAPRPAYFPMRNRIISGMSLGTLVIEAGESSGALITASFSLEQNREVFALPGSIFSPASMGTNRLIQKGAKLVRGAEDVLDELNLDLTRKQVEARKTVPDSPEESELLELLRLEPRHIDELVRSSRKTAAEVGALLAVMEIKGKVKNLGAGKYAINS